MVEEENQKACEEEKHLQIVSHHIHQEVYFLVNANQGNQGWYKPSSGHLKMRRTFSIVTVTWNSLLSGGRRVGIVNSLKVPDSSYKMPISSLLANTEDILLCWGFFSPWPYPCYYPVQLQGPPFRHQLPRRRRLPLLTSQSLNLFLVTVLQG